MMANQRVVDVTVVAKDQASPAYNAAARAMALAEIEARKLNTAMDAEKAKSWGKSIEGLKKPFEGAHGVIEKLRAHWGMLLGVVAGGALFGEAITSTIEWTGSVVQLSKRLGITTEDASGLNVALHHIGLSADDYTTVATKMTKQLRTNEDAFKSLGIRTKESNGEWRNTKDVMTDAVESLNDMKAGTDRNIAAQQLFGARSGDLTAILRLNHEMLDESAEKAKKYHLVIGPEGAAQVRSYKGALADLRLVGESLAVQVGNAIIPILLKLGTWLGSEGPSLAGGFAKVIQGIASAFFVLKGMVEADVSVMTGLGMVVGDLMRRDWAGAKRDAGVVLRDVKDTAKKTIAEVKQLWAELPAPTSKVPTGDTLGGGDGKDGKDKTQKTYIASLQQEITLLERAAKLGVLRLDGLKRLWALEQIMVEASRNGSLSIEDRVTASIAAKTLTDADPLARPLSTRLTGTGKAPPMATIGAGNVGVDRGPLDQSMAPNDSIGHNIAEGFLGADKAVIGLNESLLATRASIAGLASDIGDTLRGSVDAFAGAWGEAVEQIAAGSGNLGKVLIADGRKAIGGVVSAKGSETMLDASKAFALGFHDPSQFLVAAKLFAVGTGYKALAGLLGGSGGGGGASGGGGGGGLSGSGFQQSSAATQGLGKVTVVWPGSSKSSIDPADPTDQAAVIAMFQKLFGNRDIDITFANP